MKTRACVLAILLATHFSSPYAQQRDENEIVLAGESDPDMVAAIKKARTTLADFLALAKNPEPSMSKFKLKVMVKDGTKVEHFWVIPFRTRGEAFEGILANEPRYVRNVQEGQTIQFSKNEISDWGYIKDGRQVGSFTVCALFKKMPPDQVNYYRKNHGFDC